MIIKQTNGWSERCYFADISDNILEYLDLTLLPSFFRRDHLKEYKRSLNPSPPQEQTPQIDLIPCPHGCPQKYSNRNNLRMHLQHIHRETFPFQCETCKMGFEDSMLLERHKLKHARKFMCERPECSGKRFSEKRLLDKHMTTAHSGKVVIHRCHICGKHMRTDKGLRDHISRHNEASTNCEICGKFLKNTYTRLRHIAWHAMKASNSLAKCHMCSYTSIVPSNIRAHIERAHGAPKMGCELCDKKYRSFHSIKKHRDSELHNANLERLGLVDLWRMREDRWGGNKAFSGGTVTQWGKMSQFVTLEEAERIMAEEENNAKVVDIDSMPVNTMIDTGAYDGQTVLSQSLPGISRPMILGQGPAGPLGPLTIDLPPGPQPDTPKLVVLENGQYTLTAPPTPLDQEELEAAVANCI